MLVFVVVVVAPLVVVVVLSYYWNNYMLVCLLIFLVCNLFFLKSGMTKCHSKHMNFILFLEKEVKTKLIT